MDVDYSPQPLVEGEKTQTKQSYADKVQQKQFADTASKFELCPITIIHGEPTIEFTMDEVNEFTREEGLHQAVVMKFSYGKPELQEIRRMFSIQFDVQGRCNIGQLDYRHLLVRFDLYTDFVKFVSRSTGYIKDKGDEFFFRTFPWTFDFNPKEETTRAVVWISLPGLPTNLFAKKSLLSIASAAGKVLAVDKATQDRTRPSTARAKVILDLLDNHPKKVKLRIVDKALGKSFVLYQDITYDNLPKYCFCCKHQGHDENACRFRKEQIGKESIVENEVTEGNLPINEAMHFEKLKGDARDYLNAKKAVQNVVEKVPNKVKNGQEQKFITSDQQEAGEVHYSLSARNASAKDGADQMHLVKSGRMTNATDRLAGSTKDGMICRTDNNIATGSIVALKDTIHGANTHNRPDVVQNCNNSITSAKSDIPASAVFARMNNAIAEGHNNAADRVNQINVPRSVTAPQEPLWSKNNGKTAVQGSNGFEALELDEARQFEMTNNNNLSKDIVPVANMETKAIARVVESKEMGVVLKDSRTYLEENMTDNSCNVPTIFFSTPHVEDIIKKAQAAMMKHTNMVRQPLVTLNTSDVEIPSLSEHSFEKYEGDSKQLKLSTGIENEDQGQREHEDEEDWEDDDEREFTDYESDDEELRSIVSPPIPSNQKKKLNMNAPAFIPKEQQQLCVTEQLQTQVRSQQNICPKSRTTAEDGQIQNNSHTSNQGIPVNTQQPFVSNYQVQQIIKQNQKDMIQSKLVKFFKPMVMSNTSTQDAPSHFLDSCGEFEGEGSTDNDDQSGEEEEGDFSSTEEEEDESDECDEDVTLPVSPSTPKMDSIPDCQSNSKPIVKAPHLVPKEGGQQVTQLRPRAGQQQEKNHTQEREDRENKTFQISESGHKAGTNTTVQAVDEQQQHSGNLHDHVQTIASSSARNQPKRGTTIEILARANEETNVRQLPMRVAKQKQVVSNASKNNKRSKK